MMIKKIIAGNWKMNKTGAEAVRFVEALKVKLTNVHEVDVVVCPPFTALNLVHEIVKDSNIGLGGQNLHWEESGAFTGEVSALMLKAAGCQYVILGHSERRQYFGETNEIINKKLKQALRTKLIPILCIGEMLTERQQGKTEQVVEKQLSECLSNIDRDEAKRLIVAYEPVWAIGTGVNATPEQAEEIHVFIRKMIEKMFDAEIARNLRIQYGGSVKSDNAEELLNQKNINGALVGGASLDVDSFVSIVKTAQEVTLH